MILNLVYGGWILPLQKIRKRYAWGIEAPKRDNIRELVKYSKQEEKHFYDQFAI